jgi:hypothetical protein
MLGSGGLGPGPYSEIVHFGGPKCIEVVATLEEIGLPRIENNNGFITGNLANHILVM